MTDLRCERARRETGLQAKLHCRECRLGPCTRELETARAVRTLPHTIPNRLHGAAINAEGCAI